MVDVQAGTVRFRLYAGQSYKPYSDLIAKWVVEAYAAFAKNPTAMPVFGLIPTYHSGKNISVAINFEEMINKPSLF